MLSSIPKDFFDQSYINLETYKKNGTGVKTPVWFVIDNDLIYVITRERTGKVKRIKNNPSVKVCICSFSGNPKGEWYSGKASLVKGEEAERIIKLRNNKYGFKAKLAGFITKSKGNFVVYSILLN